MANTNYGVNHPLAVKVWAKKLFEESLRQTWFAKFIGSGSESVIQRKDDLKKGPGDRITIGLRMLLSGAGIQGDDTLEGNEEALTTYSMNVLINQLRHAVRSNGLMSEQRVSFSVREEAMQGLADWWAQRIEESLANQLVGNTTVTDTRYTGNNATTAPSTNQWILANSETAEVSLSTSTVHQFSLSLLDTAVSRAKTQTPRIRPARVNGEEYYVAFLHPYQVRQMRTNTNTGQWLDIEKAAFAARSSAADSPIFTGALGVYNGVIMHECPFLPVFAGSSGAGTNVRRAVFAGAQAAVFATGAYTGSADQVRWREKYFDYENQLGVSSGMIFGAAKSVFNSLDFGTLTISSYSPSA